jgi:hypothetical protein
VETIRLEAQSLVSLKPSRAFGLNAEYATPGTSAWAERAHVLIPQLLSALASLEARIQELTDQLSEAAEPPVEKPCICRRASSPNTVTGSDPNCPKHGYRVMNADTKDVSPSPEVQHEPKPTWAVALDKMRDYDGNQRVGTVELTSSEAIAFVNHYLSTSAEAASAARERDEALRQLRELAGDHEADVEGSKRLMREELL